MITFHHQIVDRGQADLPVCVTYCGLCRSERVYDINVDGQTLDFTLVGAISFNATFEDNQTGTWWRQETGEAAKGKLAGRVLEDVPAEQMTLGNWLKKYPEPGPAVRSQVHPQVQLHQQAAALRGHQARLAYAGYPFASHWCGRQWCSARL